MEQRQPDGSEAARPVRRDGRDGVEHSLRAVTDAVWYCIHPA